MIRYGNEIWLYALALVPVVLLVFWLHARWRRKALERLGDWDVLQQVIPTFSKAMHWWKRFFLVLGITALIIGIANPQVGTKYEEVKREGFELMICLDISNSMMAEDLTPNRLARAKQSISKLIDRLKSDRIGVVVFAGDAYIQLPLTVDHAAAKLFLRTIGTDMIPTQGTDIAKAIELAKGSFNMESKANKAVVVITDGESHESDALDQAIATAESGITVHTVGIGSAEGSPIPQYRNGRMMGYRKDRSGNTVVTKLNETLLQKIAAAGGGTYVRANNTSVGLDLLMDELESMERAEYGSKMFTSYEDRFQIFLAVALFFLLIELLIPSRKLGFLSGIDIFKKK